MYVSIYTHILCICVSGFSITLRGGRFSTLPSSPGAQGKTPHAAMKKKGLGFRNQSELATARRSVLVYGEIHKTNG